MTELDKIFDSVGSRSLFRNKQTLQSNHSPEEIPHRNKQIEHIASILAPSLLANLAVSLLSVDTIISFKNFEFFAERIV